MIHSDFIRIDADAGIELATKNLYIGNSKFN